MFPQDLTPEYIDRLLRANGYEPIGLDELEDLGAIKTLTFNDNSGNRNKSIGIYNDFIIKPNKLIEHQNILIPSENISTALNAEIRVSLTNDLEHFYVYGPNPYMAGMSFNEITELNEGMPVSMLPDVDLTNWVGDIGLALYISELSGEKPLLVRGLYFTINTNVDIIAHGEYKITFNTMLDTAVEGVNDATDQDIDNMFN